MKKTIKTWCYGCDTQADIMHRIMYGGIVNKKASTLDFCKTGCAIQMHHYNCNKKPYQIEISIEVKKCQKK